MTRRSPIVVLALTALSLSALWAPSVTTRAAYFAGNVGDENGQNQAELDAWDGSGLLVTWVTWTAPVLGGSLVDRLDPSTGFIRRVASLTSGYVHSAAWDGSRLDLFESGAGNQFIWRVDPSSGIVRRSAATTNLPWGITTVADGSGGVYVAGCGTAPPQPIFRFDSSADTLTESGTLPVSCVQRLGWDGGRVYAFSDATSVSDPSAASPIYTLDPATGATTLLSATVPADHEPLAGTVWDGTQFLLEKPATPIDRLDPVSGHETVTATRVGAQSPMTWAGTRALKRDYCETGNNGDVTMCAYDPATDSMTSTTPVADQVLADFSFTTGGQVYLMGEWSARIDTATGLATGLGVTLRGPGAFDGNRTVYGVDAGGLDFDSYDIVSGAVTDLGPVPVSWRPGTAAATWDGTGIDIFGGADNSPSWNNFNWISSVYHFDPATARFRLSATLSPAVAYSTAFWDGTYDYLVGGWSPGDPGPSSTIIRYDPATSETAQFAHLQVAQFQASIGWDGREAYILGGFTGSPSTERISLVNTLELFDPVAGTVDEMGRHPLNCVPATLAWTGQEFLGARGNNAYLDHCSDGSQGVPDSRTIVTFDPRASAPAVTVSATGPSSATLSWSPPVNAADAGVAGYQIYRSTASGETVPYLTVGNRTSLQDTGLTPGALTYYRIAAIGAHETGEPSSEVAVGPSSEPLNLTASIPNGGGPVSLGWSAPQSTNGSSVGAYQIYRGTGSGPAALIATVSGLTYTDSAPPPNTRYHYRVTAVNVSGESAASAEAAVPNPPSNGEISPVVVPGPLPGDITVATNSPAYDGGAPVLGIVVYRSSAAGVGEVGRSAGPLPYVYNGPGACSLGDTCSYWVAAYNFVGTGEGSAPRTVPGW
ncbi:MAG: fibronectin type III domain-containing protein [Candidatus Dormibacteria bacterium]